MTPAEQAAALAAPDWEFDRWLDRLLDQALGPEYAHRPGAQSRGSRKRTGDDHSRGVSRNHDEQSKRRTKEEQAQAKVEARRRNWVVALTGLERPTRGEVAGLIQEARQRLDRVAVEIPHFRRVGLVAELQRLDRERGALTARLKDLTGLLDTL